MLCVAFLNCLVCLVLVIFPISDYTWHGIAIYFFLLLLLSAVRFIFEMALLLLLFILLQGIGVALCCAVWLHIKVKGHTARYAYFSALF